MPGSELDMYDVGHVPIHPLIDQDTRNITVSSFELAERERETHLLRKNLMKLKQRYAAVTKSHDAQREEVRLLKAKLSSGGLAASFANLDAKYQALKRRHEGREDTYRHTATQVRHLTEEVATLKFAVEMKVEDFGTDRDMLLEVARGGRTLAARDAAIAKLRDEFEVAEREAADLKGELLAAQQSDEEHKALAAQLEEKLVLLTSELESVGQGKEELFGIYETLSVAHDTLTRNFREMEARHAQAAQRVAALEHEQKDQDVYHRVLETQLEQARQDTARVQEERDDLRRRLEGQTLVRERDEAALHSAEVSGTLAAMQQRVEELLQERRTMQEETDRLRARSAGLERDVETQGVWKDKIGELEASLRRTVAELDVARERTHALETRNAVLERDADAHLRARDDHEAQAAAHAQLEADNAGLRATIDDLRRDLERTTAAAERQQLLSVARDEVSRQRSVSVGSGADSVRRSGAPPSVTPPITTQAEFQLQLLQIGRDSDGASTAPPQSVPRDIMATLHTGGSNTTHTPGPSSASRAGHLSDVPTAPSSAVAPPGDAALVSSAFAMATNSPQQRSFTISEVSPSPPSARKTAAAAGAGGRKTISLYDIAYGSPGANRHEKRE